MNKLKDLTGQVFGLLTAKYILKIENERTIWSCDCSCGTKDVPVREDNLVGEKTHSCGCLRREMHINFLVAGAQARLRKEAITKKCTGCKKDFEIILRKGTYLGINKKAAEKRNLCDKCSLKKALGTKPSKYDW